ncbi:MAG: thiS [Caulobacter sp.]|nr:thiS [Caulobacter sp.]
MRIQLNGEEQTFDGVATVAALVAALELDPRKVAVDRIEIVTFIGGG